MSVYIGHHTFSPATWPIVMGILNVTPDSFSDAGAFMDVQRAIEHALEMLDEGATIIDVGGESTRPGSKPVPDAVQIDRVVPVVEGILAGRPDAVLSVDTTSSVVATAALEAGAQVINDISAGRQSQDMFSLVASRRATIVLMHMRGTPLDMQHSGGPHYDDVVDEVAGFLADRARIAEAAGISLNRIIVDPGLGFGKRHAHNLELLARLERFSALGHPVLLGASRKSFIGRVVNRENPAERLAGSLACIGRAIEAGVAIVRVHDVAMTSEFIRMAKAIRTAGSTPATQKSRDA